MTMKLKSAVTAALFAAVVTVPAMASTLYSGGASYPYPAYTGGTQTPQTGSIFDEFGSNNGHSLFYCGVSSGFGKNLLNGAVNATLACPSGASASPSTHTLPNFIGTDATYTTGEYATFLTNLGSTKTAVVQYPSLVGAIVLPFRHSGTSGNVTLTLSQVCSIFTGAVTNWSGVGLPAKPIHYVYRSSNSGTTFAFSTFVANNCNPPSGPPVVTAQQAYTASGMPAPVGNSTGVTSNSLLVGAVNGQDGAIGYADPGDVVSQSASYLIVDVGGVPYDPLDPFNPFVSPTFVTTDLLIDQVVNGTSGALPNYQSLATANPTATRVKGLVALNPATTVSSGYPIFAVTYIGAYARGNNALNVGSDSSAFTALQDLGECLAQDATNCSTPLPTSALPPGFAYIDLDNTVTDPSDGNLTALGKVLRAIGQIQN